MFSFACPSTWFFKKRLHRKTKQIFKSPARSLHKSLVSRGYKAGHFGRIERKKKLAPREERKEKLNESFLYVVIPATKP